MDLWTEFEGVTIDSSFALKKLLQTEGRSAFFSTVNDKGEPVLIRIIECHFDEDEILARWRGVQALAHPNFLRIDRFGQFLIEADGITAVYAVFERADANLAEVLERGRLTPPDARQIGLSLASALDALHASGFVHEHVEPAKVYAVGETVKLRSDCIRETPEGEAGLAARQRDVHDLALVINQVLLGGRNSGGSRQANLPAPFDELVRRATTGEWGLAEIREALAPPSSTAPAAPARKPAPAAAPGNAAPVAQERQQLRDVNAAERRPAQLQLDLDDAHATESTLSPRRERVSFDPPAWTERLRQLDKRWLGAAAVVILLLLFSWMLLHRSPKDQAGNGTPPPSTAHTRPVAHDAQPAGRPSTQARGSAQTAGTAGAVPRTGKQWRVVAFTYSRQDQAKKKAASLAQSRPGLAPDVFSPTGKAPWLVTIGGALDRDAAYALAHKARSLGLPRDTYAQNYRVP